MADTRPVVCTYCNRIIYDYSGPVDRVVFDAEHFEPRHGVPSINATSKLVCPLCGERWVSVSVQLDSIRMAVDPATRGTGNVKY
ncbi:MAG: hypothetical protein IPF82_20720 [Blastocatellia bacterium]|jgi:uncharacterized Zn-finger protein|nr:hypothetical protein [Blastocatellia bacterium]